MLTNSPEMSLKFSTLVDLLCYRAQNNPHQKIYTFLQDGEIEAGSLTYQEVDRQGRAIAVLKLRFRCYRNLIYWQDLIIDVN